MTVDNLAFIPSPSQGVWEIGPLPLRAYAVCIIVGIVVAILWGNRRYVARGGRAGMVTDISVFAVPFGIVGGRLYHVITDNQLYFGEGRNPWRAFAIWEGGLGIWGAVALGAVGAWLGCRRYGVPLSAYADSIAPGLILAQAIGRVGNYFNQELFGSETTVPWALEVYVRTPGGQPGQIPLSGNCEFDPSYIEAVPQVLCGTYHPTFLYEILWNLGVVALVLWADKKFRLGGGRVFALYVAGYTLGRGWIESLRIDPANTVFGLRINVITSIVVFLGAVVFLVLRRGAGREDPDQLLGKAGRAEKAEATSDDEVEVQIETGTGDLSEGSADSDVDLSKKSGDSDEETADSSNTSAREADTKAANESVTGSSTEK